MKLLDAIGQFGVKAVLGRDILSAGEIVRARYAEYIVRSYQARAQAVSWPDFVQTNPEAARVLDEAERLANA